MRRGIAAMLIGAWSSIPSLAHAQSVATTTLRGIVRDSLLVVGPLPGAVITLVSGVSVTTDASGRFAVPNVAPGRVRLDISHPAYDSLDITLPAFDLEVPASDGDTIVLALPGFATVARTVCGAPSPAGAGLIFGDVRSAADGGSTRGVIASIEWTEFAASTAGVVRRPQAVRDTTDADGRFVLCGVPLDLEPVVTFIGPTRVRREALAVGTGPLRRVRLRWPSAETTARVRLRVTDSAGPVANARIDLTPAGGSARTADDGWATLPPQPVGAMTLVVRALGRTPVRLDVALAGDTALTVPLSRITTLATVRVEARGADSLGRAIADRQRRYRSYVFGDDRSTGASSSYGFWTKVPGMTLRFDRSGAPVPTMTSGCLPTLFVDEQRFERWQPWLLQEMLRSAKRLELYTLPQRVPQQFQTTKPDPCGAIVIWTW